jgi:hypothetical protein
MKSQKTYFACLDYEGTLIPGGAVRLGHIIADVSDPSATLNHHPLAIPDDIPVLTATIVGSTQETVKRDSKIIRLFLDIRFFRALFGSRRIESEVRYEYKFERIHSSWFKPTSEYYARSIAEGAAPRVQKYLRDAKFKDPLYMVVGLKEVIGGGTLQREVRDRVLGMKVESEVTSRGVTLLDDNTYLFAFKVVQLKCSEDGKISSAEYNKGAIL